MSTQPSLASLEVLTTLQSAYYRSRGTRFEASAESRLYSAAVDCGMAYDHDDLHGWVATTVCDFLLSGPDSDEDDGWGIARDETGRWEYAA